MRTLSLTILLITLFTTTLFAQDCNNPLLNIYRFQSLNSPQSGADLPYCEDLKTGQTCCSAETVSSFQNRLNDIIDKLNNYDAARDLYIARLKSETLDKYRNLLEDVNDNLDGNLATIRQVNGSLADQLQSDINAITQANNEAGSIDQQFDAALEDYQDARANCFTTALQIHASAWCLACDPNYATQGVAEDGTVAFSDTLCEDISEACWPYFNQSARFNPLIRVREAFWRLAFIERYLNNVSSTGQVGDFNITPDPYHPLSSQQTVTVPEQWVPSAEEMSMTGQCQDLWAGDKLLSELLTIGGNSAPAEAMEENEVMIAEEEESVGSASQVIIVDNTGTRLLQDTVYVWFPNIARTGLLYNEFLEDPADFFSDLTDLTDGNNDLTDLDD